MPAVLKRGRRINRAQPGRIDNESSYGNRWVWEFFALFLLSHGNRSDICMAQELLSSFDLSGKLVLADKGYDSDKLADWIKNCGGMQKSDAERHLHGVLATLSRCKATSQGNSSIMVTRTIYVRLIIIHGGKNGKLQRNSLPIVTEPEPAANP